MRSTAYEESSYGLDMDLLTISHKWSISYDSGLVKKGTLNTRLFKSHLDPCTLRSDKWKLVDFHVLDSTGVNKIECRFNTADPKPLTN